MVHLASQAPDGGVCANIKPSRPIPSVCKALTQTLITHCRWCTLPAFGASAYVPSIVLERGLFIRERNDGLYRPITYLCSKVILSTSCDHRSCTM